MKIFTEAYKKAQEVIEKKEFSGPEWQKFLKEEAKIKGLFGPDGFSTAHFKTPDKIRKKINSESTNALVRFIIGGKKSGDVVYEAANNTNDLAGLNDRAATLKFVKHLYRAQKRGGQDVWIYSPPKQHTGWIFDEIAGGKETVIARLNMEEELFSDTDMKNMCSALSLALKISEDTKIKLADKSDSTKKIIWRWFMDQDCGEKELNGAIAKLSDGFKKITDCCNSNTLVFTDYPDWRTRRNTLMGGAIPGGEGGGFPIIYIEGAFTDLANRSGNLWTCARTIIHEFSHHEIKTKDHKYRHQGLKPDKAKLPYAKAIDNADSWACFAVDLAGYMPESDRNSFLK
ncbi:M35 family metallo-endopeptidase [Methylobacter luteus]|uniref:M35 family metallo-endopeptidase n=1 Tax=Methylobacter luteus TaxID=415 RepID=UPI000423CBB9|nr:M35 family metallo-endopeptidase [Methylobacter luteus]